MAQLTKRTQMHAKPLLMSKAITSAISLVKQAQTSLASSVMRARLSCSTSSILTPNLMKEGTLTMLSTFPINRLTLVDLTMVIGTTRHLDMSNTNHSSSLIRTLTSNSSHSLTAWMTYSMPSRAKLRTKSLVTLQVLRMRLVSLRTQSTLKKPQLKAHFRVLLMPTLEKHKMNSMHALLPLSNQEKRPQLNWRLLLRARRRKFKSFRSKSKNALTEAMVMVVTVVMDSVDLAAIMADMAATENNSSMLRPKRKNQDTVLLKTSTTKN